MGTNTTTQDTYTKSIHSAQVIHISTDTTILAAMSSSGHVRDLGLSVIRHTFSSFGSVFASFGLWIGHGLALALCFVGFLLAAASLVLPIIFIAERISQDNYARAPRNECASTQCQEQDLEANVGSSEDVRTTSVERAPENATEEGARPILNKPSHTMDTAMATQASKHSSTDEQIPLVNISNPGATNAGNGERTIYSSDGENLDMPYGSVDFDRGSDSDLEGHRAHPGWPKPVKQVSFWTSVR